MYYWLVIAVIIAVVLLKHLVVFVNIKRDERYVLSVIDSCVTKHQLYVANNLVKIFERKHVVNNIMLNRTVLRKLRSIVDEDNYKKRLEYVDILP